MIRMCGVDEGCSDAKKPCKFGAAKEKEDIYMGDASIVESCLPEEKALWRAIAGSIEVGTIEGCAGIAYTTYVGSTTLMADLISVILLEFVRFLRVIKSLKSIMMLDGIRSIEFIKFLGIINYLRIINYITIISLSYPCEKDNLSHQKQPCQMFSHAARSQTLGGLCAEYSAW